MQRAPAQIKRQARGGNDRENRDELRRRKKVVEHESAVFGWTPCIGPILTGILAVAATRDTVFQGMFLLAIYSAGLAIPFLLTGLGLSQFLKFYGRFRKHLQAVEVASGVLLIGLGVLMAFNKFTVLSGYLTFLNRFTL